MRATRAVAGTVRDRSRSRHADCWLARASAPTVARNGWLLLAPDSVDRASYMPVVFLLFFIACCGLAWLLVRRLYHGRMRRAAPWACGFPFVNARMQDTAEGFGQPIREIFAPLFRIERQLPSPFDEHPATASP